MSLSTCQYLQSKDGMALCIHLQMHLLTIMCCADIWAGLHSDNLRISITASGGDCRVCQLVASSHQCTHVLPLAHL